MDGSTDWRPTSSSRTTAPGSDARSDALDEAEAAGFDGCWRAPRGLGGALGGRRHPDRGRRELQRAVRFALFHLMASVGDRARRRSAPRLSGPATAATCSGTPTSSCCRSSPRRIRRRRGRCSSTASAGFRLPARRLRRRPAGRPLPVGVGAHRRATSRRSGPRPTGDGSCRSAPASSRSTSSPTSPGRPRATSTGPATRTFSDGPGARAARRDGALLGVADRASRPTAGATSRRDRPRRVPRGGRRQRVHERDGALEPAPGRTPAGVRRTDEPSARWLARARRRARRRLRPDDRDLRAVRRLLRPRAAGHRRDRAAAPGRRRPRCSAASASRARRSSSRRTC